MRKRRKWLAAVAAAALMLGCTEGVPEAEHAETVRELTEARMALDAARVAVTGLQSDLEGVGARLAAALEARDLAIAARDATASALDDAERLALALRDQLVALEATKSVGGEVLWCHQYQDPAPEYGCEILRPGLVPSGLPIRGGRPVLSR